jgi:hypothetical protein
VTDDGAAGLAETSEPREPAGGHEAPPPKASSAPADTAAVPADREISAHECQVLAQRYGDLTRSDNMNALPQGLTAGQRQQAQSNIMSASDKLSARWEQGCIESLVGKVASEDALKCAMAAKTVADFDVCLNGPAAKP